MRQLALAAVALAVAGCATQSYRDTGATTLTGVLEVRWVKNDYFLFLPNKDEPFTLLRQNGKKIQPGHHGPLLLAYDRAACAPEGL